MTWIKVVNVEEADGLVKREYNQAIQRAGGVAEIVQSMSLNGLALSASMKIYKAIMFGESPLTRQLREMIATLVSVINHCHY